MRNVPENGQVVRFTVVPTASYASPGVDYVATRQGRTVHVRRVDDPTRGTSDATWAYRAAVWTAVPQQ